MVHNKILPNDHKFGHLKWNQGIIKNFQMYIYMLFQGEDLKTNDVHFFNTTHIKLNKNVYSIMACVLPNRN